jgi:nitrogen regulatory protein P-II 1
VKRIEAIIGPRELESVKLGVLRTGARGMTVSPVRELPRGPSRPESLREARCKLELAQKVHVQIVTTDDMVAPIVEAIIRAARTGKPGDDRIIVSPVSDAIRIRTGERGSPAV